MVTRQGSIVCPRKLISTAQLYCSFIRVVPLQSSSLLIDFIISAVALGCTNLYWYKRHETIDVNRYIQFHCLKV